MFLKLAVSRISFRVNGEWVNQGGGYDLEIPVEAKLEGHTKAIALTNETLYEVHNDQAKRYKRTLY